MILIIKQVHFYMKYYGVYQLPNMLSTCPRGKESGVILQIVLTDCMFMKYVRNWSLALMSTKHFYIN